MRLSKTTVLALKGGGKAVREKIAAVFGVTEVTVWRWIDENEPNGNLTKASALELISQETGIATEEILEESDVKEEQR
jgi:hypothetical protein